MSTPYSTRISANTHKISRVLIRAIRVLMLASRTLLMSSFTRAILMDTSLNEDQEGTSSISSHIILPTKLFRIDHLYRIQIIDVIERGTLFK